MSKKGRSTIPKARERYNRKVTGENWKGGVDKAEKEDNYCKGITRFLEVPDSDCDQNRQDKWAKGVNRVSAKDFDADVKDGFENWLKNYKAAQLRSKQEVEQKPEEKQQQLEQKLPVSAQPEKPEAETDHKSNGQKPLVPALTE